MKTQTHLRLDDGPDAAAAVSDYLREHPDFFVGHADLLPRLAIPHASGGAVSLVEKQVTVLREENQKLRGSLEDLVEVARANEALSRRMHELTLSLMEAATPEAMFSALGTSLSRDFNADRVVVRVFAAPAQGAGPVAEFAGREAAEEALFAEVFTRRRPECVRLKREQQRYLFGDDCPEDGSAVIVPLLGHDWSGVLVVASDDPQRYHPGMGVDLLAHLGDIVGLLIGPWVAPAAPG